jgi:Zn-dependent protease
MPGALVCPRCGSLLYRGRLEELTADALRLEPVNPAAAAMVWRQCLDLLPPDSSQYAQIYQHLGTLVYGQATPQPLNYQPRRRIPARDDWRTAVAKTVGSMLVSILVYWLFMHSMTLAVAFVVLMLVHEMGHVLAMRYYGLSASPPIFIPFVGALINLRQQPPNAKVEAIVGIGGPALGTVGALVCYAMARRVGGEIGYDLLMAANLGFFLNLFNLLPVPPLDGGRITAAISPWLWIVGLIGLIAFVIKSLGTAGGGFGVMIPLLILFYSLPRIRATLQGRDRFKPYYAITRGVAWAMAAAYFGLGLLLSGMLRHTGGFSIFF